MARSRLIAGEYDILGGQELDNDTNNFERFLLGHTALKLIMRDAFFWYRLRFSS